MGGAPEAEKLAFARIRAGHEPRHIIHPGAIQAVGRKCLQIELVMKGAAAGDEVQPAT